MISSDRLKDQMIELVKIDSESKNEKNVGEHVVKLFEDLGLEVEVDNAGENFGSNYGNIYAKFRGSEPDRPVIILSAHLDTVVPGIGINPIVEGDKIRTDGSTILASDDKSGIAIIIEVIKNIQEANLPSGNIEVILSVCEELGMLGAKQFDISKLEGKFGYALDSTEPYDIYYGAPSANTIDIKIKGLAAHAGMAPEKGINAIKIASEAIAQMTIGRHDEETTSNIGVIKGGSARNIVADFADIQAEVRSHSEEKLKRQTDHIVGCVESTVAKHVYEIDGETKKATAEIKVNNEYKSFRLSKEGKSIKLALAAGESRGVENRLKLGGGGTDSNIFNAKGIEMAVIGTGMRSVHTVNEYIYISDMEKAANMIAKIIELNV